MAAKFDDRTARGWPLPHRYNKLWDDVMRVREAFTLIDQTVTAIEGNETSIVNRQDLLDIRMDTIAGQTTEDTEILDARIDAEGNVYPNLGNHIRTIHSALFDVVSDIDGILRQFNALAQAQTREEINDVEAHNRRKQEIQIEALTRLLQDDGLQHQINDVSYAALDLAQTIAVWHEEQKSLLANEEAERRNKDGDIVGKIDKLAEAVLRNTLNIRHVITKYKEALSKLQENIEEQIDIEVSERVENDWGLARQNNASAEAILQTNFNLLDEKAQRQQSDNTLDEKILLETQERKAKNEEIVSSLDNEISERLQNDNGLAYQSNANAQAILQTGVTLANANQRRKAEIIQEGQERQEVDSALQKQINKNSSASIKNSIATHQEAEARRKKLSETSQRIDALVLENENRKAEIIEETQERQRQDKTLVYLLDDEVHSRVAADKGLARQANANANASLRNSLNIKIADEKRKADIAYEEQVRTVADANLQRQNDRTAQAAMRNSTAIHAEAEKRSAGLQVEEQIRFAEDAKLQGEIDTASEAILRNTINILLEAKKRRELAGQLAQEIHTRELEIADLIERIKDLYEIPLPGVEETFALLQAQADKNAQATLENSISIHAEAVKRREDITEIGTQLVSLILSEEQLRQTYDKYLQSQIDKLSTSGIKNSCTIHKETEKRRNEDTLERFTRYNSDGELQRQIDKLAETCLRIITNNSKMQAKLKEVAGTIEGSTGVAQDTEVEEMLDNIYT